MKSVLKSSFMILLFAFGLIRCMPEQTEFNIVEVQQPTVKGKAEYGQTLEAVVQSTPSGWTRQVNWYRDAQKIDGATELKYKLVDADIATSIRVGVLFEKKEENLKSDESFSKGSDLVSWAGITPELQSEDVPLVGSKLEVKSFTSLQGWKSKLNWYLVDQDNVVILKDSLRYTTQARDVGKKLRVGLFFVKGDKKTKELFSPETKQVVFIPKKPVIDGIPLLGRTLHVRQDVLEGWNRTLRWYRDTELIEDAIEDSYTLTSADKGSRIRVASHFTAKTLEAKTDTAYSEYTAEVNILEIKKTPLLVGKAEYNQQISISNYDDAPAGWQKKFRWYRIDQGVEELIVNEKAATYTLTSEDIGAAVKGVVIYYMDEIEAPYSTPPTANVTWDPPKPFFEGKDLTQKAAFDSVLTVNPGAIPFGWNTNIKWYRVKGIQETKISDSAMVSYTLRAEDIGHKMKVEVVFTKGTGDDKKTLTPVYTDLSPEVSLSQQKPVVPDDKKLKVVGVGKGFEFGEVLELPTITPPAGWILDVKWYLVADINAPNVRTLIAGENGEQYIIRYSDKGKFIFAEVAYSRGGALTEVSELRSDAIGAGFTGIPTQPVITGTPVEYGRKLTTTREADRNHNGVLWSTKLQWYRGDVPITNTDKLEYTLGIPEVGKTIKVGAYFQKSNGARTDISFSISKNVTLGVTAPTKPTISGTAQLGQTFTASGGGTPETDWRLEAKWYLKISDTKDSLIHTNGADATTYTYDVQPTDVGSQIKVSFRFVQTDGTKTDGKWNLTGLSTLPTVSDLTNRIAIANPEKPVITGNPFIGEELVIALKPNAPGYDRVIQWKSGTDVIPNQDKTYYNLEPSVLSKRISACWKFVNKINVGDATAEVCSDQTAAVAIPNIAGKASITGKPYTGNELRVDLEDFGATASQYLEYKIQWYKANNPIVGATDTTYKIEGGDIGTQLSVGLKLKVKNQPDEGPETKSDPTAAVKDGSPSIQTSSIQPADNSSVSSRPTFVWSVEEPDGGTLSYQVLLSETNNPPLPSDKKTEGLIAGYEYTNFKYTPTEALKPGTPYYWQLIITDGEGSTVKSNVYTFTTSLLLQSISYDNMGPITAVGLYKDKYIVTASNDYGDTPLRLIEISTGNVVHRFDGHTKAITQLAVSKTGDRCVSASDDETIKIWSLTDGDRKELASIDVPAVPVSLDISDDGTFFYASYSSAAYSGVRGYGMDGSLKGEITTTHKYSIYARFTPGPLALDISPDGNRIVVTSRSTNQYLFADIWSLSSGGAPNAKVGTYSGGSTRNAAASQLVKYTPDNSKLFFNFRYQYWAGALLGDNGKEVSGSLFHSARPSQYYDGTGSLPKTAENGYASDGHGFEISAAAFVNNDKLATGSGSNLYYARDTDGGNIKLWDFNTQKVTYTFPKLHTAPITSIAVSSDGSFIVTSSKDKTVKVWSIPTN